MEIRNKREHQKRNKNHSKPISEQACALNEKYPGGAEAQKKLLEKEGHKIVQKGKKYIVVDHSAR